ncbi:MAG: hypothetical protein J0626_10895, partial [Rhodospirillaceae bacterium]|nr:hypothetical protein [Rhodospirillaceae bacterium]
YPSTYIVHPGDLVMFGETGHESVQLIVTNIKRGDNMSATLALVDAAPGVHTADLAIPAFDDQISFSKPVEFQPPASPSLLHVFDRVELLNSILSTRVYFVFANVPTAL